MVLLYLATINSASARDLTGAFLICDGWPKTDGGFWNPDRTEIGIEFYDRYHYAEIIVTEDGKVHRTNEVESYGATFPYKVEGPKILLYEGGPLMRERSPVIFIDRKTLNYSSGTYNGFMKRQKGKCELSDLDELKVRRYKYFYELRRKRIAEDDSKGYKL